MAYGATARIQPPTRWPERRLGRLRIEYEAVAATPTRCLTIGARVDEGTIRLQVERVRAGESDALGELFREFRPDILRLCTRMLGPVDAEDATSETFSRAQRRFDRYDTTQPLGRWLRSTTRPKNPLRLSMNSYRPVANPPFESHSTVCPTDIAPHWCCAISQISITTPSVKSLV